METFNKGLNLDSPNKLQPDGTYRFALNAILETREGDYGSISNERGVEFCLGLAEGWDVIGDQLLDDDTFVLFITNNQEGSIIHFNPNNCTSTTLVSSPDFNFSKSYPIDTLFRIRKGCERTIYFTDTVNPYRVINIDNIDSYLDSNGDLDVQSLNFTPDLDIPKIESATVNNGGGILPLGSYSFAIRYLDEDNNPTNWFYTTQPVNIYDEALTADYESIDGGFNLVVNDQGEGILGGVPASNKSITLSLSNLDPSYAYYQIGVIPSVNNTASPQLVYEMNRVGIGNATDSTTITSLEEDGIIQGSLADVTVDNVNIQLVQAHEQKDNRLFLAGVSSPKYDWAKFQLAANEITTKWTTKEVAVKTLTETGDPKNPSTPFEHKTFMGDEVYALAIQYFFKDGSLSPAFHIPGRQATAADLAILREFQEVSPEDIAHIPDNEFEDNPVGGQRLIRRWKYENTFNVSSRQLGYYETNTAYPFLECEIDGQVQRVFPEGNIRHHRIPDRKRLTNTIDIDGTTYLRLIGLEFDNVTYPHEDIVGHRFLTAKRNVSNTTVVDNGVWIPPSYNGRAILGSNFLDLPDFESQTLEDSIISDSFLTHFQQFSSLYDGQGNNPDNWVTRFGRIHTPKQLAENVALSSYSYLQFLRNLPLNSISSVADESYDYPGSNTNWRISLTSANFIGQSISTPLNYANIKAKAIVEPKGIIQSFSEFSNSQDIINLSHSNAAEIVEVNKDINATLTSNTGISLKLYQISLKQNVKPYPNLESIEYYSLNSSYLTLQDDQIVFGKDAYITAIDMFNIYFVDDLDRDLDITSGSKNIDTEHLKNIYVDSYVNFDLIHDGDLDCNARYNPSQGNFADYVAGKALFQEEPGVSAWRVNETVCPEYYGYNIDYSRIDTSKPAFSLNTNASMCSSCIDSYPNRIYASQQSFQEELSDAYRIIRINDYTDLDASAGPIVDLFKNKDKLYSITPKALFFIPTSPQRLTTNEDNIYVGSADILSIPPARLTTSQSGYGGSSDKFSVCTTEFGTVFIDDTSRRIFMLAGQLEEISNKGLSNYFDNHLNFTLQDRLKSAGFAPMPLSTVSGIGNVVTYDPKFRRIIISHRDFEPIGNIQQWPNPDSISSVDVYWNGEIFLHYDIKRSLFVPSNFNDTTRWKNRSFTISYSLEFGSWTSWHSYFPQWAFWDNDTFYSTQDGNIYTHNFGEHQTYYGNIKYPHIFEVVSNKAAGQTKVFGNVNYLSTVYNWDEDMEEWYSVDDVTFDHYWAYNSEQSTGLMRIQPKGDDTFFNVALNQPTSTLAVHESDNTWTLNDLRDVFTGHNTTPISSRAWEDIQSDYFIDKVPMSVDTEFRGFNQPRLRDTFLNVRMYFNPIEDYRITTDFINTRYKQSFR